MRRRLLAVSIFVPLCLGITTYIYIGESPELERDRYFKKGEEYIAQGKFSEALIMFKNSLKADPTFAEAHYQIGLVLLQKRDFQQALGSHRSETRDDQGEIPNRHALRPQPKYSTSQSAVSRNRRTRTKFTPSPISGCDYCVG